MEFIYIIIKFNTIRINYNGTDIKLVILELI